MPWTTQWLSVNHYQPCEIRHRRNVGGCYSRLDMSAFRIASKVATWTTAGPEMVGIDPRGAGQGGGHAPRLGIGLGQLATGLVVCMTYVAIVGCRGPEPFEQRNNTTGPGSAGTVGEIDAAGTAGAGNTGGSAGGGGGAGSGAPVCTPGASAPCACANGHFGSQVCTTDGSGFDACACAATGGAGGGGQGGLGGGGAGQGGSGGTGASGSAGGSAGMGAGGIGGSAGSGGIAGSGGV